MRYTARLSAFALALAASAAVVQPAVADEATGVVTGTAWIDENADGIRQPTEPPLSGFAFLIRGVWPPVNTDENGNYRFENVPAGEHVITMFSRGNWTFTKGGGDSDFDPNTLESDKFTLTAGGQAGPFNAGMVEVQYDRQVADLDAPRFTRVGDQVEIDVTFRNGSNSPVPMYGWMDLPEGLTPLSHNAPVGSIDGQRVNLSSPYTPELYIGESVTYTVVARADKRIACGQIIAEVPPSNPADVNPENDTKTIKVWAF